MRTARRRVAVFFLCAQGRATSARRAGDPGDLRPNVRFSEEFLLTLGADQYQDRAFYTHQETALNLGFGWRACSFIEGD